MDKDTLVKLINEAQKGDRNALEKLCRISEQFVRNYFIYKFKNNEIVNDLSQETYSRLIKSFSNIREPEKYKNFVLKTAFYVMQDFLRKKAKENKTISNVEGIDESGLTESNINEPLDEQVLSKIDLSNALSKLPQKSQYVLMMHSQGYKYHEIAEKLALSESAIKMQVKRSLQRLNDILSM